MPPQHSVAGRPADARTGGSLIADLPPRLAKILPGRDCGRRRREHSGLLRVVEPPVALGLLRGDAVEDPLHSPLAWHRTPPRAARSGGPIFDGPAGQSNPNAV